MLLHETCDVTLGLLFEYRLGFPDTVDSCAGIARNDFNWRMGANVVLANFPLQLKRIVNGFPRMLTRSLCMDGMKMDLRTKRFKLGEGCVTCCAPIVMWIDTGLSPTEPHMLEHGHWLILFSVT